jgi:hypothetical protein
MSTKNSITTKRFVIRKTLIGTDTTISFTNKKGITYKYNHDEIYSTHQERFESMPCFQQYGNYTNSNAVPAFARNLSEITNS